MKINTYLILFIEHQNHERKTPGFAILFHQDEWPDNPEMFREGSKIDIELLKNTFETYSIPTLVAQNPTIREISQVINKGEFFL